MYELLEEYLRNSLNIKHANVRSFNKNGHLIDVNYTERPGYEHINSIQLDVWNILLFIYNKNQPK